MLIRIQLAAILTLVGFACTHAQAVQDLEQRFGRAQPDYSISEGMSMTAQFAADGQVCLVKILAKGNGYSKSQPELQFTEVRDFLNSFVPPETRGARKYPFDSGATGGGSVWTTYNYEKVTFTFSAAYGLQPYDGTVLRRGEFVFTIPSDYVPPKPEPPSPPSKDDFKRSESEKTQMVAIRWNERRCIN